MNNKPNKTTPILPKLRFPEFHNAGDWEKKKLKSIISYFKGFAFQSKNYKSSGRRVVRVSDMGFDYIKQNNNAIYISEEEAELYKKWRLQESDLIVTTVGSKPPVYNSLVGRTIVAKFSDKNSLLNQNAVCLRSKKSVDQNFLNNTFKRDEYIYFIESIIRGNANQGSITLENLFEYQILLPKIQEQQKIADCLSSLDDLISNTTKKLTALEQHKKGLMQTLFPADGKTTPKLRFPEFSGEWKNTTVGEYFNVNSSKRVLQKDWCNKGIPFYRTRELVSLSKNKPFGSEIYISEELYKKLSKQYGVPTEGDFLVSGVGTLGVAYQVKIEDKFYFKDGNVIWFKLGKGLKSNYFKYCFQSSFIQNQIISQTSISTVGTYTIQNAKKTKFVLPATIQEQQKIADCLSSLDELISTQSQKITTLQQHKKGLMQNLFPNNEVD